MSQAILQDPEVQIRRWLARKRSNTISGGSSPFSKGSSKPIKKKRGSSRPQLHLWWQIVDLGNWTPPSSSSSSDSPDAPGDSNADDAWSGPTKRRSSIGVVSSDKPARSRSTTNSLNRLHVSKRKHPKAKSPKPSSPLSAFENAGSPSDDQKPPPFSSSSSPRFGRAVSTESSSLPKVNSMIAQRKEELSVVNAKRKKIKSKSQAVASASGKDSLEYLSLRNKRAALRASHESLSKEISTLERLRAKLVKRQKDAAQGNEELARPKKETHWKDAWVNDLTLCPKCGAPVAATQDAMVASDRKYHIECFTCRNCDIPLAGKPFYALSSTPDAPLLPWCAECYSEKMSKRCAACGNAIKAKFIHALEKDWHVECLNCSICGVGVRNQLYANMANMPMCKDCKMNEKEGENSPKPIGKNPSIDSKLDSDVDDDIHDDEVDEDKPSPPRQLIDEDASNGLEEEGASPPAQDKGASLHHLHHLDQSEVTAFTPPAYKRKVSTTGFTAWLEGQNLSSLKFPENDPTAVEKAIENSMASKVALATWQTELGSSQVSKLDSTELFIDIEKRFYGEYLAHVEHSIFAFPKLVDKPSLLMVENYPLRKSHITAGHFIFRAVLMTPKGDERFYVIIPDPTSKKERIKALRASHPALENAVMVQIPTRPKVIGDLSRLERRLLNYNFKFGVLLAMPHQSTENEFYGNNEAPKEFYKFLSCLGRKVDLADYKGYMGGLSNKGATGDHSYAYDNFMGRFDVMFHVSTMIPNTGEDKEQAIGRKRHLGNDVVLIIFKPYVGGEDPLHPFDPSIITSHFNHIFLVVTPLPNVDGSEPSYRVAFFYKSGVRPCKPFIRHPAIFTHGENFRDFLLTKLINAELAALSSSPDFMNGIRRTRKALIQELYSDHVHLHLKKKHTLPTK